MIVGVVFQVFVKLSNEYLYTVLFPSPITAYFSLILTDVAEFSSVATTDPLKS